MANNKTPEFSLELQELAEFSRIFSHPARIAIVQLLAQKKEIKTGDISEFLPLSRTTVSQHLKELREAGIIDGTTDGLKIHYCLNMKKLLDIKSKFTKLFDNSISDFICCC